MRRSPVPERRHDDAGSARCLTTSAWPVLCEDFTADPGHRFEAHTHQRPHVCLVVEGTLLERDGRGWRRMTAGTGRLSPGGDEHHLAIEGSASLRCLVMSISIGSLEETALAGLGDRRYVSGPAVPDLARRLLAELRSLDDASPLSLEMLGHEATALASASSGPSVEVPPPWLERVRDRVRDDLRSVPTLAELARDAGVSRAHLARTFRSRYGYTIGQYVRNQRLEAARRLILATDTPLSAVALEAGFADQSHMTRLVGSRFGHPPGRLRERRRSV